MRARCRRWTSLARVFRYVGPSWRLRLYDQSGTHGPQHTDTALTDKDTRDSVTHVTPRGRGDSGHGTTRVGAVARVARTRAGAAGRAQNTHSQLPTRRARAHRRVRGSGRQTIKSRLNNTLYTSKAQALHTWMDPYLRCGTLRYTPRYRAHPDTHNRYSLSRRGVRRVTYRQARPSITRNDPSRLGSGTGKICLLAAVHARRRCG